MKTFRISIFGLFVTMFAVVALLSSCEKEEVGPVIAPPTVEDSAAPIPPMPDDTTYHSIPEVGVYTPNSSRSLEVRTDRGIAHGGVIKARIASRVGNTFIIEIARQDGAIFKNHTVSSVRLGAVSGEEKFPMKSFAGKSAVYQRYTPDFTRGYELVYPMIMDGQTGAYYYAEPILVYTDPLYANVCGEGEVFGTANGVEVRCTGENASADFCLRYIEKVYQEKIQNASKPKDWYADTNNFKHFSRYPNGGDVAPRVGDILVFSSYDRLFSEEGDGHVAIVMEVTDTSIRVAQQNFSVNVESSYWYPIGGEFQRSGNRIIDPEPGNVMRGCIVTPEPKHSIIGWMRYQKN